MGTQHSNKEEKKNAINRMMEDKSNSTYLHVCCHVVCLGLCFPSATAETLHAGTFFNRSRTLQRYISARFPSPVNFPILGWDYLKEVHLPRLPLHLYIWSISDSSAPLSLLLGQSAADTQTEPPKGLQRGLMFGGQLADTCPLSPRHPEP